MQAPLAILDTLSGALPLVLSLLLMLVGLLGTLLPILPGNLIIALGPLIHRLWLGEESVSWGTVGLIAGLNLVAQALDFLCSWWGGKRFGASARGGLGALVGGIVGIFLPPPLLWVVLGPFVGALLFELSGGRAMKEAGRVGMGAFLGTLLAFILKFAFGLGSIVLFWLRLP